MTGKQQVRNLAEVRNFASHRVMGVVYDDTHPVPSPRGGFGGLSLPNKAPSPPKLKFEIL